MAVALNTLELLVAEKASTAAASVEAIHSAVAMPVDEILNDAVNVMERYIGHEPDVVERLQRILRNARDIKQVIQKVGQTMAPIEARPSSVRVGARTRCWSANGCWWSMPTRPSAAPPTTCSSVTTALSRRPTTATRRSSWSATLPRATSTTPSSADIRLPDMSGYDLLLKLQEHHRHRHR